MHFKYLSFAVLVLPLNVLSASVDGVDYYSGNELLSDCNDFLESVNGWKPGRCLGFITGVIRGHQQTISYQNNLDYSSERGMLFCIPSGVTLAQLIKVVHKSIGDNPSKTHLPAEAHVLRAMTDAFPCG